MKNFWEKLKPYMPLLSVIMVIVCGVTSVLSYTPAVYELTERLEAEELDTTESAADTEVVEIKNFLRKRMQNRRGMQPWKKWLRMEYMRMASTMETEPDLLEKSQ